MKDKLHGANHEIIETDPPHMTKEQIEDAAENPLNRPSEGKLIRTLMEEWKKRALEAEKTLVKKLNEIETLTNGQMLSADKAAPMEVQKMKEQIIELQERLSPFKYEFTIGGTLVSVMVRPRSKEVIPLTQ